MGPLLLLHGALGSKHQFDKLVPKLQDDTEVYRINFEGHGSSGRASSPFRIEYFVENVLGFIDEHTLQKVNIFGYSMGGYVALTLAKEYPQRINKVATLGTILQWDVDIARKECRYLDPEKMQQKVPGFVSLLDDRHPYGWKTVVNQTREMLHHLGHAPNIMSDDWQDIEPPVRLCIGDQDTTAGIESTIQVYKKLPNAQLCVLPETPHPFNKINLKNLSSVLLDFF